ncbi:hypothetical protein ACFLWU_02855 [Chloroflexota bacterium]
MPEDSSCCSDSTCGCSIDIFPTTKDCPTCGKRLRITGHAQRLELRLNCQTCGYVSSLLSREELHELL